MQQTRVCLQYVNQMSKLKAGEMIGDLGYMYPHYHCDLMVECDQRCGHTERIGHHVL